MKHYLLLLFSLSFQVYAQVDKAAIPEVKKLYKDLTNLSRDFAQGKIIYGQQNAFTEGKGWAIFELAPAPAMGMLPESDLHKVVGKNPGLIGFDFSEIGNWNEKLIIDQIKTLHRKGAVITFSWHMKNVMSTKSDNSAFDTSGETVKKILYTEEGKTAFYKELDRFIAFNKNISTVPIILRLFHEQNGSWFWWGQKYCEYAEYQNLWYLTVNYLKAKGSHNFLYAFSPNKIEKDYYYRYPGDNWVDVMGVDMYFKQGVDKPYEQMDWKADVLFLLSEAKKHNKIPAITEFGNENMPYQDFWTAYLGWPIQKEGLIDTAQKLSLAQPELKPAYIMVWRNAAHTNTNHYFGPYPGHKNNENFRTLMKKNVLLFLEDLATNEE